jgi:hypothetical protein
LSLKGALLYVSGASRRLLEYEPNELLGKTLSSFEQAHELALHRLVDERVRALCSDRSDQLARLVCPDLLVHATIGRNPSVISFDPTVSTEAAEDSAQQVAQDERVRALCSDRSDQLARLVCPDLLTSLLQRRSGRLGRPRDHRAQPFRHLVRPDRQHGSG